MVEKLTDRFRDVEDGWQAYGIGNCMFALYSVGHDYELVKGGGTDIKYKIYGPHKCDWILRRAFRGWQMLQWLESDISSEDNSEQEHTDTSSEIEKTARSFVEKTEKYTRSSASWNTKLLWDGRWPNIRTRRHRIIRTFTVDDGSVLIIIVFLGYGFSHWTGRSRCIR